MTLGSHQRTIGKSQVRITPRAILDPLGAFDTDPCAADPRPWDCAKRSITERENSLAMDWRGFGRVWLNPPFDRRVVGLFIARLAAHGHGTLLVHVRTETAWFRPIWERASALLFLAGRLIFHNADGSLLHCRESGLEALRQGGDAAKAAGFRANSNRSGTTPAHDWVNYPDALMRTIERLRGVIIERRPAIEVMAQHDQVDALHYVDPPYLPETRSWQLTGKGSGNYTHELSPADHSQLLAFLQTLSGMVVLSGYPSALYDEALIDWRRVTTKALADGARERTEVLWINPAAAAALDAANMRPSLFDQTHGSASDQLPSVGRQADARTEEA